MSEIERLVQQIRTDENAPAGGSIDYGWVPGVRGGYQPATGDAGPPPTGGSGGKEPEPKK